VAVPELIDDLARLFASRWPAVRLGCDVAPGLTGACDRDQVNQALWALLQNAVEAAGSGVPPEIRLSAHAMTGALVIDVSDNGSGIAPDQRTSIFRPFHTTRTTGTGIGLTLARRIAHGHGGTLTLLPALRTTFRLHLPPFSGS
jgi:signal transduction histidine kinase